MAHVFAYLFAAGGLLALLSLALPHSPERMLAGMVLPALAAFAVAAWLWIRAERVSRLCLHALAPGATVLASLFVYSGGTSTVAAYASFYFWVVLASYYFFTRAYGVANLVLVGLAYAGVLLLQGDRDSAPLEWALAMGTMVVGGTLIALLRERLERLIVRLADLARTDPLTGLLNRRGFEERFELELERARRSDATLGLVVADLDHFKRLNDRYGHHLGDAALQLVGTIVRRTIRRIDTPARIGGEEIAIIVSQSEDLDPLVLAERVREEMNAGFDTASVDLTASFGVATYPHHGTSFEQLMKAADQALYAAKELGRNRSVIFTPGVRATFGNGASAATLTEGSLATVLSLAEVLDLRHFGTAEHSRAVGSYAEKTARELGLAPAAVERVRLAGVLHDVGKVGISDAILHKPGPLSEAEWREMHLHPTIGAQILRNANLEDLAEWVLAHHERSDGHGYPNGIGGEQIPIEARILAVADAYEALVADRVYRAGVPFADACAELRRSAGTHFDPYVVEALVGLIEQDGGSFSRSPRFGRVAAPAIPATPH